MDAEALRESIPAAECCTYLNTGATGPSPRPVVEAATDYLERVAYEAPCGAGGYEVASDARESAREAIAAFIGATPAEVALTRNTVEGINLIANGLALGAGDVVVRTDLEHSAGILPWNRLRDQDGLEVRVLPCPDGRLDLGALADVLDGADLLCLSSLTWNYGTQLPIAEATSIAHEAGARVLVDAVQSVGQTPVDVTEWGADFVVASGHKWLLGPWGSGFCYVDETALGALSPQRIGYFSVVDTEDDPYEYEPGAKRFELGTTALAPYVGLERAIDHVDAVGLEAIDARIHRLASRLAAGLGDRLLSPADPESGLVTFDTDDPESTVERLQNQGIRIRSLPDPAACRASVHAFNTAAEIDALLAAV